MQLARTLKFSFLFLILTIILDLWGDTNTRSRLALLASIKEDQSFRIDAYKHWTIDWAQTPDGHTYSNKAPGPVFLALPAYYMFDTILTWGIPERALRDQMRARNVEIISQLLSILLQTVPFIAMYLWCLRFPMIQKLSISSQVFFSFAFMLGTTATLFMNTFFGHGLAAVLAVGTLLSLLQGRFQLAGMFFGWGVLSDYGSALLLPGALLMLWEGPESQRKKRIVKFLAGGVLPGIFWIYYHSLAFGGPFTLPNRFQNPEFVEHSSPTSPTLWGIFASYPKPTVIFQLLFGSVRGLLFTQPWILIVLGLTPYVLKRKLVSPSIGRVIGFSSIGFLLLLGMNASFLNWHAGGSPGPRYLCALFPVFALSGAAVIDAVPKSRIWLWGGLFVALVFGSLVFASHRLQNPEDVAVWRFFFHEVFLNGARMPLIRFGIYWGLILMMASTLFNFKRDFNR